MKPHSNNRTAIVIVLLVCAAILLSFLVAMKYNESFYTIIEQAGSGEAVVWVQNVSPSSKSIYALSNDRKTICYANTVTQVVSGTSANDGILFFSDEKYTLPIGKTIPYSDIKGDYLVYYEPFKDNSGGFYSGDQKINVTLPQDDGKEGVLVFNVSPSKNPIYATCDGGKSVTACPANQETWVISNDCNSISFFYDKELKISAGSQILKEYIKDKVLVFFEPFNGDPGGCFSGGNLVMNTIPNRRIDQDAAFVYVGTRDSIYALSDNGRLKTKCIGWKMTWVVTNKCDGCGITFYSDEEYKQQIGFVTSASIKNNNLAYFDGVFYSEGQKIVSVDNAM